MKVYIVMYSYCGEPGSPVLVCETEEIAEERCQSLGEDSNFAIDHYYVIECEWVPK